MSWKRRIQAQETESDQSERGDTLIEVLLALVILGIAGLALLTAFATAITSSSEHQHLASLDSSVRAASDQAIAQVQQAGSNAFDPSNCTNNPLGTNFTPTWNLTGGFTVTTYTVTYWDGAISKFVPPSSLTKCTGYESQLWTMTIKSGNYFNTVSTVIYDPQAPPVPGGATPYQLVFLAPTGPGTGTVGAPVSPQPIVAVEDQAGDQIHSDASAITLTASGGGLSSSCSGANKGGFVDFGGCSFSATGTFTLTASDSNTSLIKATSAPYTITKAPPATLVFTSTQLSQTASTNAGTTKVTVQENDAFGNPVPGALTVNLDSSSTTGFFTLTSGGAPSSAVTSVSIPAGASSVSFFYGDQAAGSPTFSATSSGLQTATQTEIINPAGENKLVFSTPPATVSAGTSFSVGVTVQDQFGNTITTGNAGSQDRIQLALASGTQAATFSGGTTALNAVNGVATFSGLLINAPGSYTIKATDTTKTTVTPVTSSSFTVSPAPPSQLVFTRTVTTSQPVGTTANVGPFAVQIQNQFGNAVANNTAAPLTLFLGSSSSGTFFFTPTSGGSSGSTVTIPAGAATSGSFFYADTAAGKPTISAKTTTNDNIIVSGTTSGFTMTAGSANQLAITSQPASPITAGGTVSVGVAVQDQFGNTVATGTGSTDTIAVALSSGNFAAGTTSKAAIGGVVTFTGLQVNTSGTYTITASDSTHGTVTSATTSQFTVNAAAANKLAITSQPTSPITAGGTVSVGVTIRDQFGNTVATGTGSTDTIAVALSSGNFASGTTTSVSAVGGVVTFTGLQVNTSGTFTITASDSTHGTVTSATTSQFTVNAAAANKLAITSQPTSPITAGGTVSVGVAVQDQFGNTVATGTGSTDTIAVALSSGNFAAGTTSKAAIGGVVTFTGLQVNTSGTYTITASDSTHGTVTSATTSQFTVNAAAANKLAITSQPVNSTGGTPFPTQAQVTVEDQFGNTVTGNSSTVTLSITAGTPTSGGPGALSGCSQNESQGVVTFLGCSINTAGTGYELHATDGTLAAANSNPFNVTVGPLAQFSVSAPGTAKAGTAFTASLTAQDAGGNTVTAYTGSQCITFSGPTNAPSGTAPIYPAKSSCSSGSAVTFVAGVASGVNAPSMTLVNAQTVALTATDNPTGQDGTSGNIVVGPASENQLAITSQPASPITAGGTVSVGVAVQDQFGNTVATGTGSTDTIAVALSSGNFAAGTTSKAAIGGVVTFTGLQVNTSGTYTITASDSTHGTVTSATTSQFTVNAAAANKLAITSQPTSPITAGGTVSVGVTIRDQFGNTVATGTGSTDTIAVALSSGNFASGTTTSVSAVGGVVTFTGLQVNTSGTFTITASDSTHGTVTSATTSQFTVNAAAANKLAITSQPTSPITAGGTVSVGVAVQDQFGNTVATGTGSTDTIAVALSSGNFAAGTTSKAAIGGVVTFTGLQVNTSGTYTITASDSTHGTVTSATTSQFTVNAAAANKLAITSQPVNSTGGTPFPTQAQVTVEDQFGNTVTGNSSTVTLSITAGTPTSGGPGALSGCSQNESQGVVTFLGCSINTAGTGYELHATDGTLAAANSNPFNVTVGPLAQFSVSAPGTAKAGTAFTASLTAQDAGGNTVTAYTGSQCITFSGPTNAPSGTAPIYPAKSSCSSGSAVTFVAGVASGVNAPSMTLVNAQTVALTATDNPTGQDGTSGNIVVGPASENQLAITTPPPATVIKGTTFSMTVSIEDQFGNTVTTGNTGSNDSIHLALSTGSFAAGGSPVTGSNGVAIFNGLQINTSGIYTITASDASHTSVTSAQSSVTVKGVAAQSVASKTGTTGTSDTTGAFTTTNGLTYVVTAFDANNSTQFTPTLTVSGGETAVAVTGSTNTFGGATSIDCRQASSCAELAWTFTAASTSSHTVKVSFTGTPLYSAIDVLEVTGNNTSTPIVGTATRFSSGCGSRNCTTNTTTAVADLATAPAIGDVSLEIVGSDDNAGSTALTWSPAVGVSQAFQNGTTNGSFGVYVTSPGVQNESTDTSGWTHSGDWGTIALEIGVA